MEVKEKISKWVSRWLIWGMLLCMVGCQAKESLLYVNKISAFVGLKGKGLPVVTLVRGNVIAEDGKIVADKGVGELVKKLK